MSNRLHLRELLLDVGIPNLYFQIPENTKLKYPCVVYSLSHVQTNYANGKPYKISPQYFLILIDRDPDTKYLEPMLQIPGCHFDRFYIADNLNHWAFTIHNTGTFPDE